MCSLKAQSVVQKQQQDIEQRKKYRNEVLLKAKEQQVQQQAERTKNATLQNNSNIGTIPQSNTQTIPMDQQKNVIKPTAASPVRNQKQLTTQQRSAATKVNKEQ